MDNDRGDGEFRQRYTSCIVDCLTAFFRGTDPYTWLRYLALYSECASTSCLALFLFILRPRSV